ncbi:hypothetical protein EXIGLDRAFT_779776 [Exidia glandulosa HHB12029]|uniref:Uncharacterized protein n=1 Tax=Exidia glandulosa HHB12029 TaxID=1314781 RepID=A0A165BWL1_EXIGL|nr:hypothetical protein EXIGLDRAFT_779776 [Exidia glandulosa HHB12029]
MSALQDVPVGMCAWDKSYDAASRGDIGQIILSICCKDWNAHVVQEALRRTHYKIPSRPKIILSVLHARHEAQAPAGVGTSAFTHCTPSRR